MYAYDYEEQGFDEVEVKEFLTIVVVTASILLASGAIIFFFEGSKIRDCHDLCTTQGYQDSTMDIARYNSDKCYCFDGDEWKLKTIGR